MEKYKEEKTEAGKDVVEEPLIRFPAVNPDPCKRYAYADYLCWTDDIRRELIDGIVYVMSAPRRIHAGITSNTLFPLIGFVKRRKEKCKVYHLKAREQGHRVL
ncbi:MAG: Uma2 family endonuclease [Bacteroidales bacterium]|nr:Uma2 family endonuclease [Bacteroidales bacterium]